MNGEVTINLSPSSLRDYETFLKVKALPRFRFSGRTACIPAEYANRLGLAATDAPSGDYRPMPFLFDYQRDIAAWAIKKQKAAVFMEPGRGKTLIDFEFARHAESHLPAGKCILLIAPAMVVPQMIEEAKRFYGAAPKRIEAWSLAHWLTEGEGRFGITNYEALKETTPQGRLGCLIISESSMMKSAYGKWGQTCIRLGKGLDWKLAETGTPAPNDRIEYANHAVFLDQFPTVNSFLARFFVNRGETQNRWELKPHALEPFYTALSHWAVFVSDPAAYGWRDGGGALPPINIHMHDVPMTPRQQELAGLATGTLFGHAKGIVSRGALGQIAKGHYKGEDIPTAKPEYIANLIAGWPDESTLVWCLYNAEQESMERIMPAAASISGKTPMEKRERIIADFKAGWVKTVISKADILGFGLNLQIATRQVFSGLQDSYEEFFQAVKRSNRVGSTKPLNVHIPLTLIERPMVDSVLLKAKRIEADTREQERIFKGNWEANRQGVKG